VKRLLATALALAACGFGPLAALGAALGWLTRKRLRSLSNHTQGVRWANAAIAVGLLNSTLWVAAWTWITLEPPRPLHEPTSPLGLLPFATQPIAATPSYRDFSEFETLPAMVDDGGGREATWTRSIGHLLLTDLGNGVGSLSIALEEQAQLAYQQHRTPVLWLVASDCNECSSMARALDTPAVQRSLGRSSLIRVDAEQFGAELSELDIVVGPLPGFALISPNGTPMDYLHAGEWSAAPLELMAPLLENFVNRRPMQRRFPWRGAPRPDETPI
jgi:hypothetical protein